MNLARLDAENHRGRKIPRVLGCWLLPAALAGAAVGALLASRVALQWGAGAGCVLVFAAGLVDDLGPIGPRGIRNHLRELASGRMTTGILKLVVTAASAVVVTALLAPGGAWASISSVVLIAAVTNIGNGLDVRPGRALKWFVVVVGVSMSAGFRLGVGSPAGLWLGAWIALPADLGERAMLGDSGANLLGFAAGVQLAATIPGWALGPATVVAVVLNVVADTVSFSRIIETVPPLRWFDALGRLPN